MASDRPLVSVVAELGPVMRKLVFRLMMLDLWGEAVAVTKAANATAPVVVDAGPAADAYRQALRTAGMMMARIRLADPESDATDEQVAGAILREINQVMQDRLALWRASNLARAGVRLD
jgi:hypothetical protein